MKGDWKLGVFFMDCSVGGIRYAPPRIEHITCGVGSTLGKNPLGAVALAKVPPPSGLIIYVQTYLI